MASEGETLAKPDSALGDATPNLDAGSSRNSPLHTVIEILSVAGAFSLLASTLALDAIFSIWGLDFFTVATPSDIVVGGIVVLLFTAFMTVLLVSVPFVLMGSRAPLLVLVLLATVVAVALLDEAHILSKLGVANRHQEQMYVGWGRLMALALTVLALADIILRRPDALRSAVRLFATNRSYGASAGTMFLLGAIIAILWLADRGFGGVYWAREPVTLRNCPGGQMHLMWAGDRALVVRCRRHFQLILSPGQMLLDPVPSTQVAPGADEYLGGL